MSTPSSLIKTALSGLTVNGTAIPVKRLCYSGSAEAYIVWSETDDSDILRADDALENYITYCDLDIYSKSGFADIQAAVIPLLEENGFTWCPDRDSPDMYEADTKYYHKTLCFYIERSV